MKVITEKTVAHAKKVLQLYEEQNKRVCKECKYLNKEEREETFTNWDNEVDGYFYTAFICKHPSIGNKYNVITTSKLDGNNFTQPKWCPK